MNQVNIYYHWLRARENDFTVEGLDELIGLYEAGNFGSRTVELEEQIRKVARQNLRFPTPRKLLF